MSNATNLLSETLLSIDKQSDLKSYFEQPEKAYLIYAFQNPIAVEHFSKTFAQITGKTPRSYTGKINYVACEFDSSEKAQSFRNKFDTVIFKIKATDTVLENDHSDEWLTNTVLAEASDLLPVSAFVINDYSLSSSDVEKINNALAAYCRNVKSLKVLTKPSNESFDQIIERVKEVLLNKGMFQSRSDCDTAIEYYASLLKSVPHFAQGMDEFLSSKLTKFICSRKTDLVESSMSQLEIMQDEGFRPLISYNADHSGIELTKEQRSYLNGKKTPKDVSNILSSAKLTDQQWTDINDELQNVLIQSYQDNHFTENNLVSDKEYCLKQIIQSAFQTSNTQLLYKSLSGISNSLGEMSMIETVEKLNEINH
ncbi:hypothetical protein DZF79_28995 [Vibrio parahaemolyticus]|nr:hypothetical protein [Vibrio parahaemolyticus]